MHGPPGVGWGGAGLGTPVPDPVQALLLWEALPDTPQDRELLPLCSAWDDSTQDTALYRCRLPTPAKGTRRAETVSDPRWGPFTLHRGSVWPEAPIVACESWQLSICSPVYALLLRGVVEGGRGV